MDFQIDYQAVFDNIPMPVALLTPEFVIADVNLAYVQVSGRDRDELLGRDIFEAFPDDPSDPDATGTQNVRASLRRVLDTGKPDTMALQKYAAEDPETGQFVTRFWCPANAPVFSPDHDVVLIAHCVEEVTDRVRKFVASQTELRN